MSKMTLRFTKKSIRMLEERLMDVEIGAHEQAASAELLNSASEIMDLSGVWVPEDTGALKASRFITEVIFDEEAGISIVELGYGRDATLVNPKSGELTSSYALKVHEDLVTPRAAGKRAKFLELPLMLHRKKLMVRLTKGLEEYIGTIGGA